MLLKEKLSKIRIAGAKINEQVQDLVDSTVREEVRQIVIPLTLNDLIEIHDRLRDYQLTLIVNDGYPNLIELRKIGKVADSVIQLHFSL